MGPPAPDFNPVAQTAQSPGTPAGPSARRAALRRRLVEHQLDSLLIIDLRNIRYLTGFTGSNAALLVDVHGDPATKFCTDTRYDTQSAAEVADLARIIGRPCDLTLVAAVSGRIGFEAHVVTVAAHRDLAAEAGRDATGAAELVPVSGLVERGRTIKDAGEIDALSRACAIADQALSELIEAGGVAIGRTERDIALDLDQRMRHLGATGPGFDTIVAAGTNSAIPHHQPTDIQLVPGDLVKFDFGAEVDGYHSDMTRMCVLGNPAEWQRDLHLLVLQAQQAGIQAAVPGATGAQVDSAARSMIERAGLGQQFGHGLGHGVGLQIHEAPALAPSSAAIMTADMCLTVEPGIYLPGRGGVRIEDTGVIVADGFRVLTTTSKDLRVL